MYYIGRLHTEGCVCCPTRCVHICIQQLTFFSLQLSLSKSLSCDSASDLNLFFTQLMFLEETTEAKRGQGHSATTAEVWGCCMPMTRRRFEVH